VLKPEVIDEWTAER